jgi:hypothetical protein
MENLNIVISHNGRFLDVNNCIYDLRVADYNLVIKRYYERLYGKG